MSDELVALFQGDPQGSGMRILARTRDKRLVRHVREWFLKQRRAEIVELEADRPETADAVPDPREPR